jgi:hypothetical protein
MKFLLRAADLFIGYPAAREHPMAQTIEPIRIKTGMDLASRILWKLGWNPKPFYILGSIISLLTAVVLHSVYGLLAGLIVFIARWKVTQLINRTSPGIIDLAKGDVAIAGAKRVGVDLDLSDCRVLVIPQDSSSPLGIRPKPAYQLTAVYITDAFLATYSGSSFSLSTWILRPATTADEIYFRHVSAINYRGTSIEIVITRNKKPQLIEVGSEENGAALLAVLRERLRSPTSPIQLLAASEAPIAPETFECETMTHTARNDGEDQRYCYVRPAKLMEYYSDPTILSALMERLEVPGTSVTRRQMSDQAKKLAIEAQIEHFRHTPISFWYGVPAHEILAAAIWTARKDEDLSCRVIEDKFCSVSREEDLRRPVAKWLEAQNSEPYMEIQLGRRRIDVLGLSKRDRRTRLTAVELKNSDEEFRRGPDQMGSFAEYAHAVYLACTPAFAADYLERSANHRSVNHWDPTLLDRKLKQGGFGLLIVERDKVFEVIPPVEQTPSPEKLAKVLAALPALHKIELD